MYPIFCIIYRFSLQIYYKYLKYSRKKTRKCIFFAFFFKKIWSCQKKAVLLHPLSVKRAFDLTFKVKKIAEIAQLVEHDLAKVGVASSSLVFRSFFLLVGKKGSPKILIFGESGGTSCPFI